MIGIASSIVRISRSSWTRWSLICAFAAVMTTCGDPPVSNVEDDWKAAMARLGFISIYPVTEDLEPGDILLDIPVDEHGAPRTQIQRLGSLAKTHLRALLGQQEGGRLLFEPPSLPPAKPKDNSAATGSGSTPAVPDILLAGSARTQGDNRPRLRRAAIPSVIAARITEGQLTGAGTVSNILATLGIGHAHDAVVLIRLKRLETLGFDSLVASKTIHAEEANWITENQLSAPTLLEIAGNADEDLVLRICSGREPLRASDRAVIRVVNNVLYAHEIEFEYLRSDAFAGRAAMSTAHETGPTKDATGPATQPDTEGKPPSLEKGAEDAFTRIEKRTTDLRQPLTLPSPPGTSSSLTVGSYGHVALSDQFDEPMAVGFSSVATYGVRNSLLLIGKSEDESGQQLERAKAICRDVLEAAKLPPVPEPKSIERLVCDNTRRINASIGARFVLASACPSETASDLRPTPAPILPAFQTRDKPRR